MSFGSVLLGSITKIKTGKLDANASSLDGQYPFFTCAKEPLKISSFSYDTECVLVAGNGDLNVKYYSGKFDAYQRTYIIESLDKEKLNTRYLYHFLDGYLEKLRSQSIGGIIKYIKLGNLTEIQIPLPPLSEQQRIADILDKADELRQKRQQSIIKLDELLQATFIDMFGDPVTNPKNWEIKKISELGSVATGNTPPRADLDNYGNYLEWIKSDNLNNPSVFATVATEYLSEKGSKKARIVPKGSILVTYIAGSFDCIGNLAIVDREVAFNQQINSITPNKKTNTEFLYFLLKISKSIIQSAATKSMKGMINKSKFSEIELPIPPLEKQQNFIKIFNKFNLLKNKLELQLTQQNQLFQSLQQQAFNGTL